MDQNEQGMQEQNISNLETIKPVGLKPTDSTTQQAREITYPQPTPQQLQEVNIKKSPIFVIAILAFLLSVLLLTGYFLSTKYSRNYKTAPDPTQTPSITATPTINTDTINNWSVFENAEFSFKYPSNWQLRTDGRTIESLVPDLVLWTFGTEDPMYNECMKLDDSTVAGELLIKSYSRIVTVEACSGGDMSEREKWIVKADGEGYAPGIQYFYKSTESSVAEHYFDQILSTFKFSEASPSSAKQ